MYGWTPGVAFLESLLSGQTKRAKCSTDQAGSHEIKGAPGIPRLSCLDSFEAEFSLGKTEDFSENSTAGQAGMIDNRAH